MDMKILYWDEIPIFTLYQNNGLYRGGRGKLRVFAENPIQNLFALAERFSGKTVFEATCKEVNFLWDLPFWIASRIQAEIIKVELESDQEFFSFDVQQNRLYECSFFYFESAHYLPNLPENHPCHHLHGHCFEALCSRQRDSENPVFSQKLMDLRSFLDHRLLNEIEELKNPTSENLCCYLEKQLKTSGLTEVCIWETPSSRSIKSNGQPLLSLKLFDLQSAIKDNSKVFGHSYWVELGVSKELDPVLGWTIDFAKIKDSFIPLRKTLDHQCLSEHKDGNLQEMADLSKWIFTNTKKILPDLAEVRVRKSHGGGVILSAN